MLMSAKLKNLVPAPEAADAVHLLLQASQQQIAQLRFAPA